MRINSFKLRCVCPFISLDGRQRIEETAIGGHIERMLEILQQEEIGSGEIGTTGPCLEYLLQHRLLDTLYTLGRTDVSFLVVYNIYMYIFCCYCNFDESYCCVGVYDLVVPQN